MIQLAPKKLCTGCGACAFVCGKNWYCDERE